MVAVWRARRAKRGGAVEREWADYHDARYCVASATARRFDGRFWALGIKAGEEVIVPAVTFIATADAVVLCGGVPVFVDIDPETYQVDPDAIETAITERTKAIASSTTQATLATLTASKSSPNGTVCPSWKIAPTRKGRNGGIGKSAPTSPAVASVSSRAKV
jgi:Predicted pyridoxal phosphate-dependent enzyme apparently involved in regulation of cell wall biogenesis